MKPLKENNFTHFRWRNIKTDQSWQMKTKLRLNINIYIKHEVWNNPTCIWSCCDDEGTKMEQTLTFNWIWRVNKELFTDDMLNQELLFLLTWLILNINKQKRQIWKNKHLFYTFSPLWETTSHKQTNKQLKILINRVIDSNKNTK